MNNEEGTPSVAEGARHASTPMGGTPGTNLTFTPAYTPLSPTQSGVGGQISLLQWERELLKKERELLNRERELLSETRTSQDSVRYRPKDVVDLIPEFNPSKADSLTALQWVQKVEAIADAYRWNDSTTLLQAVSKFKGAARTWFDCANESLTTWAKVSREIISAFPTGKDESDVHLELMKRKKRRDESYEEYFYSVVAVARKGAVSDKAIMKYIITGVGDPEMTRSLALSEYDGLQQLLRRMKNYEDTLQQEKHRREVTKDRSGTFERKAVNKTSTGRDEDGIPKGDQTNMRCYNCGRKGHQAKNCTDKEKGSKCFACGKFGHKAADCEKKNMSEKTQSKKPEVLCIEEKKSSEVYKDVTIEGKAIPAMIDTGSSVHLLKATEYLKLEIKSLEKDDVKLYGLGTVETSTLGSFRTTLQIDGSKFQSKVYVVPDNTMSPRMVIGNGILTQADVIIKDGVMKISKPNPREVNQHATTDDAQTLNSIMMISEDDETNCLNVYNKEYKEQISNLIENYKPIPIKTTGITTKITLSNEGPVYQGPRRLSESERKEVEGIINKWLDDGTIKHSSSDFASPIVPIRKKDGTIRICVDYRRLNKKTVKDRYPLPVIEDQLASLRNGKVFTTLDLKNGFHHVPVDETSQRYTAFVVPGGQYEFLRTPFGLCNAPAVFQRFVNKIFQDLMSDGIVLTYMDDLIIPSETYEDGLNRLRIVLKRAEEYGLEMNWNKCQFLTDNIEYLGYRIYNNSIKPSVKKIDAVKKFPEPKSIKAVQSFLGLTGYFRKYIEHYAEIAKPLSDLLKKGKEFCFNSEQRNAFETLKKKLCEEPVLRIYNPEFETELHTDASQEGYGAVLMQRGPGDDQMHPVYSRKTSDTERKNHSYELEVMAAVKALEKFRTFLLGIEFKIITDCNAFRMTMDKKDVSAKIWRWTSFLSDFRYTIEHRSGTRMKHCDALSRYPVMTITDCDIVSRVAKLQKEDANLKPIFKLIASEPYDNFFMEGEVLYKNDNGNKLLVIPTRMSTEIIRRAHEKGHFGVRKTENAIKNDYWIPRLRDKIDLVIRNCVPCIMGRAKLGKQEGYLNPIDKGDTPLNTYHIDHLGPLPSTSKNYKYLFVVTDGFTKFTWIYPTKSTTTHEVLEKLEQQKRTFGNPKRIISDRGASFTSNDFEDYCKEQGIEHIRITTGVPRGNGQVERVNRTIIGVLTKLAIANPRQWYKHISSLQQFLNSSYQRSISTTPFQLMIGTKMRTKDDIRLKELIDEELAATYQQEREELRRSAKEQIIKVQTENRRNYNKGRRPARQYKLGETVAIKRTQFGPGLKLFLKFLGPYKVTSIQSNDRYAVQKMGTGEGPLHTTSSADQMKPWIQDPSSDEDSDQDAYLSTSSAEGSTIVRAGRDVGAESTPLAGNETPLASDLRSEAERKANGDGVDKHTECDAYVNQL